MKKRETLALFVSALNERENLIKFFKCHQWADEILVLDSGSTDGTADLCAEYGRRIIHQPLNANHNERNRIVVPMAQSDWIFFTDPDEFITDELKTELFAILENGTEYKAFENKRINFFLGQPLRHGGWSGFGLKICRKDSVSFDSDSFHDRPIVNGKIGQLKGEVLHYPNPNIHWITQKFNYISEFDQKGYYEQYGELSEKKFRWLLFSKPFKNFWKSYVKKQGYKDGIHGLIYAAMIWAFDVIRICKYAERYIVKNPDILPAEKLPDPWECRKK